MEKNQPRGRKWQTMAQHPIKIEQITYREARLLIRVADDICCAGDKIVQRMIQWRRGGIYGFSHAAPVIRDTFNEGTGRVQVYEALGAGGLQPAYISELYEAKHGSLYWIPCDCTDEQRQIFMELAAETAEDGGKAYDYKDTWKCIIRPFIPLDLKKFNCSEWAWFLKTRAGICAPRFGNDIEIAPVPGDLPVWTKAEKIYELLPPFKKK